MKRKEIKELVLKEITELVSMVKDIQKEIIRLKMEVTMGKTKNVHVVSRKRDDIARIKTIIAQKKLVADTKEEK